MGVTRTIGPFSRDSLADLNRNFFLFYNLPWYFYSEYSVFVSWPSRRRPFPVCYQASKVLNRPWICSNRERMATGRSRILLKVYSDNFFTWTRNFYFEKTLFSSNRPKTFKVQLWSSLKIKMVFRYNFLQQVAKP